jgi:hypothetical protein
MNKYTSFQGKRVYLLILSPSQYIATEALEKEKNTKIIRFSFHSSAALIDLDLLIVEVSKLRTDTPHT